uniref:Ig-like domain-containing protein n=1 Tax=Anas platyrhynchos platyrhynchos TaxID=8840 RepID=A0A493TSU9_ANAPP
PLLSAHPHSFLPASLLLLSRTLLPNSPTREGTGIDIACSHPNIQSNAYIHWYRQFPGQGPSFLVRAYSGSQDVTDPVGRLSVAGDRRSSTLRLARPRLRDAAVYYC